MSTSLPRLSAVVVAHDEERQLADCLDCLGFADEIVVVLDRCRDRSREIALRYTEQIVEGAWEREGPRRHAGIDACRGEWILEVDADERVPSELAAEIGALVANSTADWHLVPIDNYIGVHPVRWGWGASFGRSAHAALFRKSKKRWGAERVHPSVTLSGQQGAWLQNRLLHFVDRDISDMLRRLDRYTTARARDLCDSGDIGSYARNLRRIPSRFWKCYVGRRGYREGPYGFLIALCAALYPILSYLKARLEPMPEAGPGGESIESAEVPIAASRTEPLDDIACFDPGPRPAFRDAERIDSVSGTPNPRVPSGPGHRRSEGC